MYYFIIAIAGGLTALIALLLLLLALHADGAFMPGVLAAALFLRPNG